MAACCWGELPALLPGGGAGGGGGSCSQVVALGSWVVRAAAWQCGWAVGVL